MTSIAQSTNRRVRAVIYLCIAVCTLTTIALMAKPATQSNFPHISMLNIGQGDSLLIQSASGAKLLIDGGPDETVLTELAKVLPSNDHRIDVVIATHPDADHINGLTYVVDRYDIGLFITSKVFSDSRTFARLFRTIYDNHIPAYFARRGMTVALDSATRFSILFPDRDTSGWETNTASVVGRLDIGNTSALFTGDSPISVETFLAKAIPNELDVDILKLGHHGSKTSSSSEFLKATSPILALVSAGIHNRYKHPHEEVLDRLRTHHIPWVSTQDRGTYTLYTDGKRWYEY